VLGKFARGLPATDQTSILRQLRQLHQNTAIVFPEEVSIDTLRSNGEGTTAFLEAIDYHNREIARAILGQTLTTDEGRRVGSLALGKVHLQVLLMQLESVRRELADIVMTEQIIRPLIEMNFGPGPIPRFVFEKVSLSSFTTGELS
jgi:phage gp29-like protein